MQDIDRPGGDLRTLSRGASAAAAPFDRIPSQASVPPPKFAWKARVLVPAMILVALALLLGYSARDALLPAVEVRVVPVVVKTMAGEIGSTAGGVTVQA